MNALTIVVLSIHVLLSLALIGFILLKSGRGGGLSDMFGGASMNTMSGSTVVERNLDRLTVITGVMWTFTTVILSLRLA